MYNKILNPNTNRYVSIHGKTGKNIIKKYIQYLQGGNVIKNANIMFTMYYAPWCGFCKTAKPEFEKLLNENVIINGKKVTINMINCDENQNIRIKENIKGLPTFILYNNGEKIQYNGERTYIDFKRFLFNNL